MSIMSPEANHEKSLDEEQQGQPHTEAISNKSYKCNVSA